MPPNELLYDKVIEQNPTEELEFNMPLIENLDEDQQQESHQNNEGKEAFFGFMEENSLQNPRDTYQNRAFSSRTGVYRKGT